MSTGAKGEKQVSLWDRIEELRQEAAAEETAAMESWQLRCEKLEEMRGLLDEASKQDFVSMGATAPPRPAQPARSTGGNTAKKPARPVVRSQPPAHPKSPARPATPKGASPKAATPKAAPPAASLKAASPKVASRHVSTPQAPKGTHHNGNGKHAQPEDKKTKGVQPHERNYGQEMTLPKAMWDVLDREPTTYHEHLDDYPKEAVGLKVAEIKLIIEKEGRWKSAAENISPQIQQILGKWRNKDLVSRNSDDRRYFIVEGAEPPFNDGEEEPAEAEAESEA